jgi:hypothetical protein
VTTILFIFAIVFINKLAFALLKMRYQNRTPYDTVLPYVDYSDLAGKPEDISRTIENRRGQLN